MLPALTDGDYVMTSKPRSFRPGSIYVINHIDLGLIVKRLDRTQNDKCIFSGDNLQSVPDAIIAAVHKDRVTGQVRFVIGPKGIRRPQPRLP